LDNSVPIQILCRCYSVRRFLLTHDHIFTPQEIVWQGVRCPCPNRANDIPKKKANVPPNRATSSQTAARLSQRGKFFTPYVYMDVTLTRDPNMGRPYVELNSSIQSLQENIARYPWDEAYPPPPLEQTPH